MSGLFISTRLKLTNEDRTLTREGLAILSDLQARVAGDDGEDKVAEAKTEAVEAKTVADTVTATVSDGSTGLAATAATANAAETTANAVNATISDGSTGLVATKAVADAASTTASGINTKLTGLTGYTAATISDPPTQAEMQAIADALEDLITELKA